MKKEIKFEFTLSGFIIALIIIAMCTSVLASFLSEVQSEYGVGGSNNNTLGKYNQTNQILEDVESIRDATDIQQESGALDVIGGYFSSGYSSLKIATKSLNLFGDLLNDASEDIEGFALIKIYIYAFILIAIFVGIVITVLVKMRV